jgi:hypothetical protein
MEIRKHDMSEWRAVTHRCSNLESAMFQAERHLLATPNVALWPFAGQWLVVAYSSSQEAPQ